MTISAFTLAGRLRSGETVYSGWSACEPSPLHAIKYTVEAASMGQQARFREAMARIMPWLPLEAPNQ